MEYKAVTNSIIWASWYKFPMWWQGCPSLSRCKDCTFHMRDLLPAFRKTEKTVRVSLSHWSFFFFFLLFLNLFFKILFLYIYIFSTAQHGDPVTHTCIHSFFSHYIFHHNWLGRVPSATQQDPTANPSWRQHSASIYPKLPVPPLPPWQPQVYSPSPNWKMGKGPE